jgi:hypothetical protein
MLRLASKYYFVVAIVSLFGVVASSLLVGIADAVIVQWPMVI